MLNGFLLLAALRWFCYSDERQEEPSKPTKGASLQTTQLSAGCALPEPFSVSYTLITTSVAREVNVLNFGAIANGNQDNGPAIQRAITYARAQGIGTVYFPNGVYLIQAASGVPGTIKLANGVSLRGAGRATTVLKLMTGPLNPAALFYQEWQSEPEVSNLLVEGLTFDGSLAQQQFDAKYEFCHAFSINNGQNIEVRDCKFTSFRGDGLLFGDTDEPIRDARITRDIRVHDNEFYDIYREGCMFCCTEKAVFYRNRVHGAGYLVGGVDIERHSANETVREVEVYQNVFDFRQGLGPVERGAKRAHYRRAVAMGFFYAGYPQGKADGRSSKHKVHDNIIYQGQIDCYGHTNVSIIHNTFLNYYEDVNGIAYVTPHAILVADARSTTGLADVRVADNYIQSQMQGSGIVFNNYTRITAVNNRIKGVQLAGIQLLNSSGTVSYNSLVNVGTVVIPAAGIQVSGDSDNVLITRNTVQNTQLNPRSPINYAVELAGYNRSKRGPLIEYNTAINVRYGVVWECPAQRGYATLRGNRLVREK